MATVRVTVHDLDANTHQYELVHDVIQALTSDPRRYGLEEGAFVHEGGGEDHMVFKLHYPTAHAQDARKKAWKTLGAVVFEVHAQHWIGQPGGWDPLNSTRGLAGDQVTLEPEPD